MSKRLPSLVLVSLISATVLLGACDEKDDQAGDDQGVSLDTDCTPEQLQTLNAGTLTIGTDSPAYPPYFVDDDPTNGEGFESAVAYAIAAELGYAAEQVEWVEVPFNASYAPGPKDFDFDVNQISITEKRAEQVDFSSPYYTAAQAVVALKDSDAAAATALADLADAKLGVQIGTTSLDAAETSIASEDTQVFDNSNDVVAALKQGAVDAVVVDVPTAFYLTAVQVPEASIVGQFEAPGGDQFGALLEKDSPLTACVSAAVDSLSASGELEEIEDRWMSTETDVPILG